MHRSGTYTGRERTRESDRVTDLPMLPVEKKWTETHDDEVTVEKTGELLKTAKRTTFSLFSFLIANKPHF